MRVLDVPAGAGGFSLGALMAGCEVHGVEVDADAVATHRFNIGPCDLADMREWHPTGRYDVVVGGVPCQSFSVAGKRGGMRDPRGELCQHLVRIAVEAGASVCVLENVRGLLSSRDDETGRSAIDVIEAEFRKCGFVHIARVVLNAKDYGVPQSRQRLFVAGFVDADAHAAFRWPDPTHGPPRNLFGLPPYVTVRVALGLGLFGVDRRSDHGGRSVNGMRSMDVDAPGYTIGAKTAPDKLSPLDSVSPCVSAAEHKSALAFGSRGARTGSRRAGDKLNPALSALAAIDRPAPTIGCDSYHQGESPERPSQRRAGELAAGLAASGLLVDALAVAGVLDRPATTVDGRPELSTAGNHLHQKQGAVRLTARQCATLQSFPESFEFHGDTVASVHRQIGNAVPPLLGAAVMGAVRRALESP